MALSAHTNAVGTHILDGYRIEESEGIYYNPDTGLLEPFSQIDGQYTVPIAMSVKPPPTQGNRESNYNYSRQIYKVVEDTPKEYRTSWYNPIDGVTASYDYLSTKFISKDHGPFGYNPVELGIIENMYAESKTEALNRLSAEKAQLLADLAQARQVVDLFAKPVITAAKVLLAIKRGHFGQVPGLLGISPRALKESRGRSAADLWLQYQYGWKPLAQSIYDTQKVLHTTLAKGHMINSNGGASYNKTHQFVYRDEDQIASWKAGVQCQLGATMENPTTEQLQALGLLNPLSVAWELVPWSFAVDWFIPVGATLEACTATYGLNFYGGRITEYNSYELSIRNHTGRLTPWVECLQSGHYLEKGFSFKRTALTAFPNPSFYADLTPYSTPRALNAIALVRQLGR